MHPLFQKFLMTCMFCASIGGANYTSNRHNNNRSRASWRDNAQVVASATPSPSPVSSVEPESSPTPVPSVQPTAVPSPTPSALPSPTPTPAVQGELKWGAYVGWQDADLPNFEKLVGKKTDMLATFVHWGNEKDFPSQYGPTVRDQGKTLVIYWEAKDYNNEDPNDARFSYDSVTAGNWDTYFKEFAAQAKTYGGPVILCPFDEMNDNVSPWSITKNGNSPAKHVAAYRHIRDIFRTTAPNVKFGWAVNSMSVPNQAGNQFEEFYPGDAYVDYVGVDGFNFGEPWNSFDTVFAPALNKLAQYKKPIYIFSMGSKEGVQKANWIVDGLGSRIHNYPGVVGWIWFNENKSTNGEVDWRINSDAASLSAFKAVIPE